MVNYGKSLRVVRAVKELTQGQVAEAAAISANYVSMIESGLRAPSTDVLLAIAKALNVPMWAIVVIGSDDVPNDVHGAAMATLVKP